MEVFYAGVIVKECGDDMVNGVYRADTGARETVKCEVIGVGPGFLNEKTGQFTELPVKVGDKIIVAHYNWLLIDCVDGEKIYKISPELMIMRA